MRNNWEDTSIYLVLMFGLMLIGIFLLFGEFIFSGKMLYGSDFVEAGLYHRTFLVDHFKQYGSIPQWDPHEFGGMPYVDAFHGDTFYPLSVLKFILPVYYHFGLCLVLHIFLSSIFMYLAAREFGIGRTGSLVAAASYMFAPYLISLVASGHDGNIYVATLFPLAMLFLHRGLQIKPFLNFTFLALVLGAIFLSPHPRMSYFTIWGITIYTIYRLAFVFFAEKKVSSIFRPIALLAYSIILALMISSIQIYPGYIYTSKFSVRTKKQDNWAWATSWSLHEEDLMSQIIPEFSGFTSSLEGNNNYWGKNAFKDSTETVGIIPLFLAVIGLAFSKRREAYFFGGLAICALIYALGATTPIFKLFYHLVPLVKTLRAPAMIMFLFSFSIALLAGFGIQAIIDQRQVLSKNTNNKFFYFLVSSSLLMLLCAVLFSLMGKQMLIFWNYLFFESASTWEVQQGLTKFDIALLNLPSIKLGAWFGFFLLASSAFLISVYINKKQSILVLSAIVLIPIIDGVRFNSKFISVVDPEVYLKGNNVTDYFETLGKSFRVHDLGTTFPTTMLHQFGIETVDGYHGNQLRSYDELFKGRQSTKWTNPRFLNLVGAKYLMLPANTEIQSDYYGPHPLEVERKSKYLEIVRNDNAFNRVYLVNNFKVITDFEEMKRVVLEGQEDLKYVVYLEESPDIDIPPVPLELDSSWIISRVIDSILVGVNCTSNRILVLTENYYESWQVFIDGHPKSLMRAYGTFRAVTVPAGSKRVLFKYIPDRYEIGKKITLGASIYAFAFILLNLIQNKFQRKSATRLKPPLPRPK